MPEADMPAPDPTREPDNGPDTTPGIPPSRPAPLTARPVADTAFRPPERDGLSGLSMGLGASIAVFGLYALFNWPWSRPTAAEEPSAPVVAPAAAPAPGPAAPELPAATAAASPAAVAAAPPADVSTAVHRCEKAGEVTYTDGPCPAGTRGAPVDTRTALSVEGQRGATLYRCRGAGQFWSVVHCQHRGGEVVSIHTVPADLSLAEQIVFAQNRAALSRPTRSPVVAAGPPAPPDAASMKAAACRRLDENVAALDAYARQPLSGGEQDRVARQRRDLRDEQFRLRCGR
jgi:hypothetical protein